MALRTPLSVTPHLYMGDSTGRPLDKGVVYFGEQDKDPEFYPINLFSDDGLTKPLAQPIHTKGGYLYDKGDMVEPHAKELIYSVKVLDSYGRKVFYKGAMMRNSWNDDVIEQINTAIVGSADVARQVATDITNDAINNTAVEGGVLADTFVVVDGSLSQRTINKGLESIADLSTIKNPKDGLRVYVKSYHAGLRKGGGFFVYDSNKASINDNGHVINGWVRDVTPNYYNVQNFGAVGDGNHLGYRDHEAFNAISKALSGKTSGNYYIHIPMPPVEYVVGRQNMDTTGPIHGLIAEDVINIVMPINNNATVLIKSDNAKIVIKNGLKFGTFSKETNKAYAVGMPFYPGTASFAIDKDKLYTASLGYMLNFENVHKLVVTGNLELDGNRDGLSIGGQFGDVGWQLPAYGLRFAGVKQYYIEDVYAHHHCLDGIYVGAYNSKSNPDVIDPLLKGVMSNVISDSNSRQGMSVCGGQNLTFNACTFSNTGLDSFSVSSAPKAGVDLEPEQYPVRRVVFNNCLFMLNKHTSVVSDVGDTKDVKFNDCEFIGMPVAIWVNKPRFKFNNCKINGQILRLYLADNEEDRIKFEGCNIKYDPSQYDIMPADNSYLVQSENKNPIFRNCEFTVKDNNLAFDNFNFTTKNPEGMTLHDCVINFHSVYGEMLLRSGPFVNVTIKDYRTDPSVTQYIHASGLVENLVIRSMTEGVASKLANYPGINFNEVNKPMLLQGRGTLSGRFERKGIMNGAQQIEIESMPKVTYSHALGFPDEKFKSNVGDRCYCLNPDLDIDYWICTKAGLGNNATWKAIQATPKP